jgi:hypothetical protein
MTDQPDGDGEAPRFPPIPIPPIKSNPVKQNPIQQNPVPLPPASVRPGSDRPKPVKATGAPVRRPRNALGPFVPEANRPFVPGENP